MWVEAVGAELSKEESGTNRRFAAKESSRLLGDAAAPYDFSRDAAFRPRVPLLCVYLVIRAMLQYHSFLQ